MLESPGEELVSEGFLVPANVFLHFLQNDEHTHSKCRWSHRFSGMSYNKDKKEPVMLWLS